MVKWKNENSFLTRVPRAYGHNGIFRVSVPVVAGGRLAGTVGKFGVGALNIQTDDKLSAGAVATNFSIVRLKRDILRRSNVGFLASDGRNTSEATVRGLVNRSVAIELTRLLRF